MSTRTEPAPPDTVEIDLDAFDRITTEMGLTSDADRARAIGMDHGIISRLRSGHNRPGPKFIARTVALGIPFAAVFKTQAANR